MPRPIEDKQVLYGIKLRYHGKELEAALLAWQDMPTFKEDCQQKRAIKEAERIKYMNHYLKKLDG